MQMRFSHGPGDPPPCEWCDDSERMIWRGYTHGDTHHGLFFWWCDCCEPRCFYCLRRLPLDRDVAYEHETKCRQINPFRIHRAEASPSVTLPPARQRSMLPVRIVNAGASIIWRTLLRPMARIFR